MKGADGERPQKTGAREASHPKILWKVRSWGKC